MPQEVKEIGQDKEIIALENTKPILCDKIRYYEDRELKTRIRDIPEIPKLDMEAHYARTERRVRAAKKEEITFDKLVAARILREINDAKSPLDVANILNAALLRIPAINETRSKLKEK